MITKWGNKYLGFMFQTAKCLRVQNSVTVTLKAGTYCCLIFGVLTLSAITKGS